VRCAVIKVAATAVRRPNITAQLPEVVPRDATSEPEVHSMAALRPPKMAAGPTSGLRCLRWRLMWNYRELWSHSMRMRHLFHLVAMATLT